jgi:hypothetical protein
MNQRVIELIYQFFDFAHNESVSLHLRMEIETLYMLAIHWESDRSEYIDHQIYLLINKLMITASHSILSQQFIINLNTLLMVYFEERGYCDAINDLSFLTMKLQLNV